MARALPLLLLCALCAVWGASAEANATTTPTPTPTPTTMEKGSKWGLVVVCVCGGVLVIAGGVYAYSELRECCSPPAPPAVRGVKKVKEEEHGHSHDGKKKEKKDKEHGHSHDGKEKKEKKEKHGHSHDGKKKESKDKKQDAEKQSLLGAHGTCPSHFMHRS